MILLVNQNYKMAKYILKEGAKVDYVSSKGKTALHLMVELELVEQCHFLLKKGAN